jgi:hypothetical protein
LATARFKASAVYWRFFFGAVSPTSLTFRRTPFVDVLAGRLETSSMIRTIAMMKLLL